MALRSAVDIEVVQRGGVNVAIKSYCTPPFKVMNITEDKAEGMLRFMLMNSSPGILDGDYYDIRIRVGAGCSLELQTQSFQRLFRMKTGARQNTAINLGPHAYFKYLPHPTVPHAASDFVATNMIFLDEGSSLIWGEVFTCGRKLNGELFEFTRFQNKTEIYLDDRLVIKENLIMQPAIFNASGMGQLEGFTHQATLICIDPSIVIKAATGLLSGWLDQQPGVIYGVTAAPVNGVIIRLLGNKAEQLFDCLKEVSLQVNIATKLKLN